MNSTTRSVLSDGVALAVTTWGEPSASPLVLVHGYPDNHLVWKLVAEQLAGRFYVIAYDVRGAGNSDVPPRVADYRMAQLSADLLAVVEALIPGRRFHLAGMLRSRPVTNMALRPLSPECHEHYIGQ